LVEFLLLWYAPCKQLFCRHVLPVYVVLAKLPTTHLLTSELAFLLRLASPPQACRQHVLGGSSLLQKRSYRVLSYLVSSRPEWLQAHLVQVLELLLLGSAAALSPAKRYRLRWVTQNVLASCCCFILLTLQQVVWCLCCLAA
jgi:hypothetical protein